MRSVSASLARQDNSVCSESLFRAEREREERESHIRAPNLNELRLTRSRPRGDGRAIITEIMGTGGSGSNDNEGDYNNTIAAINGGHVIFSRTAEECCRMIRIRVPDVCASARRAGPYEWWEISCSRLAHGRRFFGYLMDLDERSYATPFCFWLLVAFNFSESAWRGGGTHTNLARSLDVSTSVPSEFK